MCVCESVYVECVRVCFNPEEVEWGGFTRFFCFFGSSSQLVVVGSGYDGGHCACGAHHSCILSKGSSGEWNVEWNGERG